MVRHRLLLIAIAVLVTSPSYADQDRFAVAGITEAEARSMFEAIQSSLRSNDHDRLAELVEYPLLVNSSQTHKLIADRSQFLADFPSIFTRKVRQQVLTQQFEELLANWEGVMFGNGAVWFSGICGSDSPAGSCKNPRVRITAVNLDAPR